MTVHRPACRSARTAAARLRRLTAHNKVERTRQGSRMIGITVHLPRPCGTVARRPEHGPCTPAARKGCRSHQPRAGAVQGGPHPLMRQTDAERASTSSTTNGQQLVGCRALRTRHQAMISFAGKLLLRDFSTIKMPQIAGRGTAFAHFLR